MMEVQELKHKELGIMDPDDARLYLNIEWLDFGSLELTKKNTNQDLIDGAKFNIKSVSYDGYNENTVVKNGKICLRPWTPELRRLWQTDALQKMVSTQGKLMLEG